MCVTYLSQLKVTPCNPRWLYSWRRTGRGQSPSTAGCWELALRLKAQRKICWQTLSWKRIKKKLCLTKWVTVRSDVLFHASLQCTNIFIFNNFYFNNMVHYTYTSHYFTQYLLHILHYTVPIWWLVSLLKQTLNSIQIGFNISNDWKFCSPLILPLPTPLWCWLNTLNVIEVCILLLFSNFGRGMWVLEPIL